jgi:hypothetical protein
MIDREQLAENLRGVAAGWSAIDLATVADVLAEECLAREWPEGVIFARAGVELLRRVDAQPLASAVARFLR